MIPRMRLVGDMLGKAFANDTILGDKREPARSVTGTLD